MASAAGPETADKEEGRTAATVGAWIWSVFAILLVLGGLMNHSYLVAALLAVSVLFAFPALRGIRDRKVSRKVSFWAGLGFGVAGFIALGATAPVPPPSALAPATVATKTGAAPGAKVTNSGYYEPILNLDIDLGEQGARDGALLERAGDEVLKIGKAMIAGKPPVPAKIEAIHFTVLGPRGSAGRKIAHFTMNAQELRQLAHVGVNGVAVLDSSRELGSWTPANDDIVSDYCRRHAGAPICSSS